MLGTSAKRRVLIIDDEPGIRDLLSETLSQEIRLRVVIGDEIVKPMKFFEKEREIIRHHHEHFDGSGYPDSASGREIPVTARILGVADSFDAMTSNRPYRQARTHEFAIGELKRCSGTQFYPEVVRMFLETSIGGGFLK
jgi:response regulator RpfG family c-di-GMP phosphodiesterase